MIEKGRYYPEMPPAISEAETDAEYTDRLTGADGTDRIPYDHVRNRQCSIGYHNECSESIDRQPTLTPETRRCQCPCHTDPDIIDNHYVDYYVTVKIARTTDPDDVGQQIEDALKAALTVPPLQSHLKGVLDIEDVEAISK